MLSFMVFSLLGMDINLFNEELIMIKKIAILSFIFLLLMGCSHQRDTLYYAKHPEQLKIILTKCNVTKQTAISNPECRKVANIYSKLINLSNQLIEDPENFGKLIISKQIKLINLQNQLKDLRKSNDNDKDKTEKIENEIKHLKNDIKLRIYFVGKAETAFPSSSMMLSYYFPIVLTLLVFLSGLIWLIDKIFFARRREKKHTKEPWYVDYSRSFFPVLLIVLIIRAFIAQPMVVPSGSLEPTILTKEYLVVNMYKYGLRLPILQTKIFSIKEPKRGDIVVFKFPGNTKVDFVKRLIGVPGDHIIYKNKTLYVNGKKMPKTFVKNTIDQGEDNIPVEIWNENFEGIKHQIYLHSEAEKTTDYNFTVPEDMYFMMGDNRDGSADSRFWGFVPEKDIVGKAELIWMSWNSEKHWFRWYRIGKKLYNS